VGAEAEYIETEKHEVEADAEDVEPHEDQSEWAGQGEQEWGDEVGGNAVKSTWTS
jgi:hypothetical protein